MLKIVHISDVHGKWNKLVIPECDILISTGDFSFTGEIDMIKRFHEWMEKQDARHYISVMGNHEKFVEKNFELSKQIAQKACPGIHFIDEGLVEIEGIKIYCSAITPFFYNWAWNRYPGEEIQRHWDMIPEGIDILATHGPAYNILDGVPEYNPKTEQMDVRHCGCPQLLKKIEEIKPKYHLCGHIHGGFGTHIGEHTTFINASICDEDYKPTNKPIMFRI